MQVDTRHALVQQDDQEALVLSISAALHLPLDALTHVLGIVAQRGAGKSYCASVLMEEMVEHGLFVGYVDPLGITWGIRASADGEHAGYPVLILGGRHGDLPLDPASGAIVSQFVLEQRQPFILDLSLFEDEDEQRQFVAEFIRGFRLHEEVLCHLIVDEADLFAPQVPQSPMAQRSLTAMNRLTRRYRYKGMGCTLITQRPAELHKRVLGQIDLLLALRVISPQDSKALDDWIKRNAGEAERAQFLATLSGLQTGTAWAWSPQWLSLLQQVAIRTRRTFDSSATPKVGVKRSTPRQLAEIDLERGTFTFYRHKVHKTQTHWLSDDTAMAVRLYFGRFRPTKRLFEGDPRSMRVREDGQVYRGKTREDGYDESSIYVRIRELGRRYLARTLLDGRQVPLENLSPHDLRHSWATEQARKRGVSVKALQDAGGWSNPITPLGYIVSNEIANDELIDLPPAQPRSRRNS